MDSQSKPEDVLIKFFFDQKEDGRFYCHNVMCKSHSGLNGKSASNLRAHLTRCVGPDYRDKFDEHMKENGRKRLRVMSFVTVTERDRDIHAWLRFVIERNMPLSEVDNKTTRVLAKRGTVTSKTLAKYIPGLVLHVEETVRKTLPDMLGIMFDGWTSGSTHYIAIIATFLDDKGNYKERLLGCSPPLNESRYGAAEHKELLEYVLEMYDKSLVDVKALIGDNCNTNKALAAATGKPLIGCVNHKLNLAVWMVIKKDPELCEAIDAVAEIMKILRTMKGAFALREETTLRALRANITRWNSTFHMLDRYLEIEEAVRAIPEVEKYMPFGSVRSNLIRQCTALREYAELSDLLQTEGLSYVKAARLIELACTDHPELRTYLTVDATSNIMQKREFEVALLKLTNEGAGALTREEEKMLAPFQKKATAPVTRRATKVRKQYSASLAQRAEAALAEKAGRVYVNLDFLPASSASVERLFSQAKLILTDQRRGRMTPVTFESLLFLKSNSDLWGQETVSMVAKRIGPIDEPVQATLDDMVEVDVEDEFIV